MNTKEVVTVGVVLALALSLFLSVSVSPGLAEKTPYPVRGYVFNSTGYPVPAGVTVNITDVTKDVTLQTTTDDEGYYDQEIYEAIPESEDGDLFRCSATYMLERGSCSFILNRTANTSQRCNITLKSVPVVRPVELIYNENNIGYNYIAWTGDYAIKASELVSMIREGVGTDVFPGDAFISYFNTTSGDWEFFFGDSTGTNFVLQQYEVVCVRVVSPGGTFYMPA